MRSPSPGRLLRYTVNELRLGPYLARPGDGRKEPRIPAKDLLWSQVISQILRETSFHGTEALVRSTARRGLKVSRPFGDDALSYFSHRLDPAPTRDALASILRLAKRNKAFSGCPYIGLAIDGTGAGRSAESHCRLCHPVTNGEGVIQGHLHHFCLITVVGTGLTLPFDVEPYGPGDSEYAAGQRLIKRAVKLVGSRFADYVVVDSGFATAPFLHAVGDEGLKVVARLKGNLRELSEAVERRFSSQPPTLRCQIDGEDVELWDADDFDPWETLRWKTVRVIRYRQHKRSGEVVEADWLTDFPSATVPTRTVYKLAKSRWEVENQGFNDGKTRYGMEHIRHHTAESLLACWLILILAVTIERLYRLRYLRRGTHPPLSAIGLVRLLRLALGLKTRGPPDSS